MIQPPGFEQVSFDSSTLLCKLQKALYGLKQAPQAWFEKLKSFLLTTIGIKVSVVFLSNLIMSSLLYCLFI